MKLLLLLCIAIAFFVATPSYSKCTDKPVTVAIIDSGFGYLGNGKDAKLCKFGHKDFTTDQEFFTEAYTKTKVPLDRCGHGTNIAGIISDRATQAHVNFCMVILKYYQPEPLGYDNGKNTIKAIQYATNLGVDFINYSGGGAEPSAEEYKAIEIYINRGGTFITAAGNDGRDLDKTTNSFYPAKYAMYDKRIIVVGLLDNYGVKSKLSNYGSIVSRWEIGMNVLGFSSVQSGTSQATAVATGRTVAKSKNRCE